MARLGVECRVSLFFAMLTMLEGFPMLLSSTSGAGFMPARSAYALPVFQSTRARRLPRQLCALDLDVLDARTMVADHVPAIVGSSERSSVDDDNVHSIGDVSFGDHIFSAAHGVVNAVGVSR